MLAGQIGMTPGLMSLYGTVENQFDQILVNYERCLVEMLGGDSKVSDAVRGNIFNHTCLKAILYISKTTVMSDALKAKLLKTFAEIPFVVVRANTLPKNAPVELEMVAIASKSDHECIATPGSLSLTEKDSGRLAYQYIRFDSIQAVLESDQMIGAGRIDVYLQENEKLD